MAEIRPTIFQKELVKSVKEKADNTFLQYIRDAGMPNVEKVQIPQELDGERPTLGGLNSGYFTSANNLNAAQAAAAPVIRVNDKIEYTMDILKLPHPIVIETLQEDEVGYNKMAAIVEQTSDAFGKAIADYTLTKIAQTTAGYIYTTNGKDKKGDIKTRSAAATTGAVGGYAGAVNRFGYEDLRNLINNIKRQNLQGGVWYALPTIEFMEDILNIEEVTDYSRTGRADMLAKGFIGAYSGVQFLDPRHNLYWNANVLYDVTNAGSPVPVTYEGAVNANCVSGLLAWNTQAVERNVGAIVPFSQMKSPLYMGDIYNWGVRVGAAKRRQDSRGVITILEGINNI